MRTWLQLSILRSAADNGYRLAINGTLLDQKPPSNSSEIELSTHKLADLLDLDTLVDMLEYKKDCERLKTLFFVSNRELSEWLEAKKGRRILVVKPNQMINQGVSYETWPYSEDTAELNARNAGDIFVVEAGTNTLEHLTRRAIGLDVYGEPDKNMEKK